jgi:circadian clock protein KaiB
MGSNGTPKPTGGLEGLTVRRPDERYALRLYVTGLTPRSSRAIASLRALCEEHLAGRYDLEIIDLYQQPERARQAQVFAAPTLVKELPLPVRRLIGDLSDAQRVLAGLDLRRRPTS